MAAICAPFPEDRTYASAAVVAIISYGITDLTRTQANAYDLLDNTRNHWSIENRLHGVRDVTFGEDASRVRGPNAPQVFSAVRSAVINELRLDRADNLAATLRSFAWQTRRVLTDLGILKE